MRLKKLKQTVLIIFILINIFTYIGAYFLTHFSVPGQLGFGNKPSNSIFPSDVGLEYITQKIALAPTEWLETWLIPTPSSSSVFHGRQDKWTNIKEIERLVINLQKIAQKNTPPSFKWWTGRLNCGSKFRRQPLMKTR